MSGGLETKQTHGSHFGPVDASLVMLTRISSYLLYGIPIFLDRCAGQLVG